jgi:hypothetical protein
MSEIILVSKSIGATLMLYTPGVRFVNVNLPSISVVVPLLKLPSAPAIKTFTNTTVSPVLLSIHVPLIDPNCPKEKLVNNKKSEKIILGSRQKPVEQNQD